MHPVWGYKSETGSTARQLKEKNIIQPFISTSNASAKSYNYNEMRKDQTTPCRKYNKEEKVAVDSAQADESRTTHRSTIARQELSNGGEENEGPETLRHQKREGEDALYRNRVNCQNGHKQQMTLVGRSGLIALIVCSQRTNPPIHRSSQNVNVGYQTKIVLFVLSPNPPPPPTEACKHYKLASIY